jgi:hypothetical protein
VTVVQVAHGGHKRRVLEGCQMLAQFNDSFNNFHSCKLLQDMG